MLRASSRHNGVHFFDISTSKIGPNLSVFTLSTWKCASRHNEMHFLDIANSKSAPKQRWFCTFWLRNVLRATTACNFSFLIWPDGSAPAALARLLFDPLEPQTIGKNTVNRDFPTFSRTCIFFLLTFSPLSSSHFVSSPPWLFPPLLFPSLQIVGSLTSKLPAIIYIYNIVIYD